MHFCEVEISLILTQKLGFKKSSLSRGYSPRFYPVGEIWVI